MGRPIGRTSKSPAIKRTGIAADFDALVESIVQAHDQLQVRAARAVDVSLTFRNWLIGCHVADYELKGRDRAAYGDRLFDNLSERLRARAIPRTDSRELRRYKQFYLTCPEIRETLSPELSPALPAPARRPIRETLSPKFKMSRRELVQRFSFSHFAELIQIDDPLRRAFYEVECYRGNWSVRELRRQITSLYFERTGLSKNKRKLSALTQAKTQPRAAKEIVRDPYVFEFLGLKSKEVMGESDLEDALLDKLEDFLLELGHGFCFEARQKRIIIGG